MSNKLYTIYKHIFNPLFSCNFCFQVALLLKKSSYFTLTVPYTHTHTRRVYSFEWNTQTQDSSHSILPVHHFICFLKIQSDIEFKIKLYGFEEYLAAQHGFVMTCPTSGTVGLKRLKPQIIRNPSHPNQVSFLCVNMLKMHFNHLFGFKCSNTFASSMESIVCGKLGIQKALLSCKRQIIWT